MEDRKIMIGNRFYDRLQQMHAVELQAIARRHQDENNFLLDLFRELVYQEAYDDQYKLETQPLQFWQNGINANLDNLNQTQQQKENEDMPRLLHYGQGSISLRQRKNKNGSVYKWYEIKWYDEYGKRQTRTFNTKQKAYATLSQFNNRSLRRPRKELKTFGVYFQEYFETFRRDKVTTATANRYQKMIANMPPELYNTPLMRLDDLAVQAHLNSIKSVKERFETKKFFCACLKRAFAMSKTKIDLGALLTVEPYKAAERQILPREQEQAFINLIPKGYQNHVIGYLYTGCRLSELMRVEKDDVDRVNNVITIKGANKGKGATKEYRLRKIPLLPQVAAIEFPLPKISQKWFEESMRNACRQLGIKITPHDLRHTFATRCREAGIDLKTYSQWLGHKNVSITLDLYSAHTTPEMFKREAEKLTKSTTISTTIRPENSQSSPNNDDANQ